MFQAEGEVNKLCVVMHIHIFCLEIYLLGGVQDYSALQEGLATLSMALATE